MSENTIIISHMKLSDRIQIRLQKLAKSERGAALEAGLSDAFLRNIREGKSASPRIDTLEKIAVVLQTTPQWLINGDGMEERDEAANQPHQPSEKPNAKIGAEIASSKQRLPVYGQAVGGIDGEFLMNGSILFDVLCPPQLSSIRGAYAVAISGDSMAPRYFDGEIAYIDPTRRIKKGDFVVAQIMMDEHDEAPQAFIKMFVSHNSQELILHQFNPDKPLRFPHPQVVSVHFVALAGTAD